MEATRTVSSPKQGWGLRESPWWTEIKLLFLAAMSVFVITVVIGLINGQRMMALGENVILTHVHAGTLGWITLSVFAFALWLFSTGEARAGGRAYIRILSVVSAIAFPLYVLAFLSGNFLARAVFGVPVLLAMAGFLGWIILKLRQVRFDLARLAMLYATITLLLGGLVGVLLQFQFATGVFFLPEGAFGAHPAMMVVGYLVLIGLALTERTLMPQTNRVSIAGFVQMTLFFLSGLALAIGQLLDLQPLYALNLLLSVVGVIIYIARVAPRLPGVHWFGRESQRFFALSGLFIVANIALTVYLVVALITGAFGESGPSASLLVALDHITFVGIMTNAIFGMIHEATSERRAFWPWADDVLFWGMNIGLVGFIVGLLADMPFLEPVFTPVMGLSIVVALVAYALRMRKPSAPAAMAAEQRAPVDALR